MGRGAVMVGFGADKANGSIDHQQKIYIYMIDIHIYIYIYQWFLSSNLQAAQYIYTAHPPLTSLKTT